MTLTNRDRVYRVLAGVFGASPQQLTDDAGPDTIESWDSLSHVNLVLALESELGITFTDEDVTNMLSVGLICRIVDERAGGQPSR